MVDLMSRDAQHASEMIRCDCSERQGLVKAAVRLQAFGGTISTLNLKQRPAEPSHDRRNRQQPIKHHEIRAFHVLLTSLYELFYHSRQDACDINATFAS